MKFRIKEVKDGIFKPLFYPQFKTFLFWYNIGNESFTESVYCKNDDFNCVNPNVDTYAEANDIIQCYKKYLIDYGSYETIHDVI